MKRIRIILLTLAVLMIVQMKAVVPYAQSVPVVKDNGSGNQYDKLPVNYVQIKDLNFEHASIVSGSGYSIKKGYVGSADIYRTNLIWTGKFSFGTGNTTNDANASLKVNTLPNVTLRFPGGAVRSDGTACDILLTLSEVKVGLGESRTAKINDNTTLQIVVAGGWGMLGSMPPRTTYSVTNGSAEEGINSGASIGSKYKVTMKIVDKGTTNPISSDYPTMLVEFKDLDICDRTVKKSATAAVQGNGTYAEGVELVSGWVGNAVLAPSTSDLANTLLVNTQTTSAGNTRIKVDGGKIVEFENRFNPPDCDYNTLWSGFVAAASPQGFSFYWTGSHAGSFTGHDGMGTTIGGQPTVAVKAKRINPGASGAVLGNNGVSSGIDTWHTNTHLMNSSYEYVYKPASGWYMKSLKVDGVEQSLTSEQKAHGGSYKFKRLNKYPLAERSIRNGQVLIAKESGFYTIEAEYEQKPDYTLKKTSDKKILNAYDDSPITYTIRVDETNPGAPAGSYEIKDDMANGLLTLVGEPEIKVSGGKYTKIKADNTGLVYTFNSDAAGGSLPYMIITYKAKVNWKAYETSGAKSVINTCNGSRTVTEILSSLKISKNVKGSLGDITKKFSFTAAFSGLEPNSEYSIVNSGGELVSGFTGNSFKTDTNGRASIKFLLKDNQSITAQALPVDVKFSITEEKSDHFPEYHITTGNGKVIKENVLKTRADLSTGEVTISSADIYTAEFINSREMMPVTGVPEKMVPASVITTIGLVLGLRIISMLRKRAEESRQG